MVVLGGGCEPRIGHLQLCWYQALEAPHLPHCHVSYQHSSHIPSQCLEELPEDLEWKIIYVGSAESEDFDQTLDTVYVGPVPEGRHKFVFEADPPDPAKIPVTDVVGVTVILLTCAYRNQEFIRVGYYVSNDYDDPELTENMPEKPIFDRLTRNILASNPRVTKFKINWDR